MQALIPDEEMGKYLTAFADGELAAAESLAVLEYLAKNPQAMPRVVGQQRLHLAAARSVKASTPQVPDALRQRVAAAAASEAPSRPSPGPRHRLALPLKWLVPIGAAACVTAGVFVGRVTSSRLVTHTTSLPAPMALEVTRVHVDCSRYADHFHQPAFPREAAEMPAVLLKHLGTAAPYPDLSAIGYTFAGAGPCEFPGGKTVHLLYRPSDADLADTVSVFLQPDVGQAGVEPDKVYVASAPDAPHPVLMWRTGGLVYHLVADDAATADAALAAIPTAPRTRKA